MASPSTLLLLFSSIITLINSQCIDNCEECSTSLAKCDICTIGYYVDTNNHGICSPCTDNCKYCTDISQCDVCYMGYFVDGDICSECIQTNSTNSTCTQCSPDEYLNQNGFCAQCSSNITGCVQCIDSFVCIRCDLGYFVDDNEQCSPCPENMTYCKQCNPDEYLSDFNGSCIRCSSSIDNCEQCQDQNTCRICASGYHVNFDEGCSPCEIEEYYYNYSCLLCSTAMANCQQCADSQTCVECVSSEYFVNSENQCDLCQSRIYGCQLCNSNGTKCSSCFFGFYIDQYEQCSWCQDYLQGCADCSNKLACDFCLDGYYLEEGSCYLCPEGCIKCSNATGTLECLSCLETYNFYQTKCFKCSLNCDGCNKNAEDCIKCPLGYKLIVSQVYGERRCVIDDTCQVYNCGKCESQNVSRCQICLPGYFLFIGECFICDYSCGGCNYPTSSVYGDSTIDPTITSQLLSLRNSLSGSNSAVIQEEGTYLNPWASNTYERQLNILLYQYIQLLKNKKSWSLSDIATAYELKYMPLDHSNYTSLKNSANELFNTISGINYTNEQFFDLTKKMIIVRIQCTSCIMNFGLNSTNSQCQLCPAFCVSCTLSPTQSCTVCQDGAYLNNSQCDQCDQNCRTCVDTQQKCTSCYPPFKLISEKCVSCEFPCKNCDVEETTKCTSCERPYSLHPNIHSKCYRCKQDLCLKCLETDISVCQKCLQGTFLNNGQCKKCPLNCEKCSTSSCLECLNGYFFDNSTSSCLPCNSGCSTCSSQQCKQCIIGFYLSLENECKMCPDGCQECLSSTECTSYREGLIKLDGQIVTCREGCDSCDVESPEKCSKCTERYFLDSNKICQKCGENCLRCNSISDCIQCALNTHNVNDGNCKKCLGNCLKCYPDSLAKCTDCPRQLNLINHKCIHICLDNCLQCDSQGLCLKPAEGYALTSNGRTVKCLGTCSGSCDPRNIKICTGCINGFQLQENNCIRCPEGCATCRNNECDSCFSGYFLTEDKDGSVVCNKDCSSSCIQCFGQACIKCASGYILQANQCLPDLSCNPECEFCVSGTYKDESQCKSCEDHCSSCQNGTECYSCIEGYYQEEGDCISCSAQCQICYDEFSCQVCSPGFLLQIMDQGDSLVNSMFSDICTTCSVRCKTCILEPDICTSCHNSYTLNGSTCIGTFVVGVKNQFDYNYDNFLEQGKVQDVIEVVTNIIEVSEKDVIINEVQKGSTIVGFAVSSDSLSQASNFQNPLRNADFGMSVLTSQVGVYKNNELMINQQEEKKNVASESNLPLIIGLSVGGGVLLILIISLIIWKVKQMNAREIADDGYQLQNQDSAV